MEDRNYSEEVARAIDAEVKRIVDECYQRAEKTLVENKEKMVEIVRVLLEKETLEREEFEALMRGEAAESASEKPNEPPSQPVDEKSPNVAPKRKRRLEPGVA